MGGKSLSVPAGSLYRSPLVFLVLGDESAYFVATVVVVVMLLPWVGGSVLSLRFLLAVAHPNRFSFVGTGCFKLSIILQ